MTCAVWAQMDKMVEWLENAEEEDSDEDEN